MFPYLKKFLRHLVLRKASQQSIVDWKHGNKWKTSPQPSNQRQSKPNFFQSQSQREPNMFVTLVKSTTLYSWLIKSIYWKLVFIALFTTSDKLTILTFFDNLKCGYYVQRWNDSKENVLHQCLSPWRLVQVFFE